MRQKTLRGVGRRGCVVYTSALSHAKAHQKRPEVRHLNKQQTHDNSKQAAKYSSEANIAISVGEAVGGLLGNTKPPPE